MSVNDVEGTPCQMEGCNELELLPTTCNKCKKIFCTFHAPYKAHRCSANHDFIVPTCPLCSKKIVVKAGDAVDRVVSLHIDSGCRLHLAAVNNGTVSGQQELISDVLAKAPSPSPITGSNAFMNIRPTGANNNNNTSSRPPTMGFGGGGAAASSSSSTHHSFGGGGGGRVLGGAAKPGLNSHQARTNYCSFDGCNKNELVLILCNGCKHSYCVDHRYPGDHNCTRPGNATPPPAAHASPIPDPTKPLAARKQPHDLRSRQFVNTFKTAYDKQRISEGITVAVFVERSFNAPPFFATIQRRTVMGRVLDTLLRHADVPNTNNSATTPDDQKWYIYLLSSPQTIAIDMALPSDGFLEDVAHDGDVFYLGKGPELPEFIKAQVEAQPMTRSQVMKKAISPGSQSNCNIM